MHVAAVIVLLSEERAQLMQWARSKTVSVRLARRAQIVLGAADGLDNETIAAQLGLGRVQVGRWRTRYAQQKRGAEQAAIVLNQPMDATRAAGRIGTSGLYVTADPGAVDESATVGNLSLHLRTSIARPGSLARNLEGKGLWNRLP
jgi:hypothetical protein